MAIRQEKVISILQEATESLVFEDIANCFASSVDYIDLQILLNKLNEEGKIRKTENEYGRICYCLPSQNKYGEVKEGF